MNQYYELLEKILNKGTESDDRTGTGTVALFGEQMRFDISKSFPLLTGKQTSFKMIATELLWFIRGDTNERWLSERKCNIWKEWADESGDLFDIYGKQLRRWEIANPVWRDIAIRAPEDDGLPEGDVLRFDLIDRSSVTNRGKHTNTVRKNGRGGEYVVLGLTDLRVGDHREYVIQFLKTGWTTTATSSAVTMGSVRDVYAPTQAGVGYWGVIGVELRESNRFKALLKLWQGMINRCYNESQSRYRYYGGAGATVCRRWHCLANFVSDASTLPGYENWLRDRGLLQIDKDYYGASQYGRSTSVFLPKELNIQIQSQAAPIDLDGVVHPTYSSVAMALGVSRQTVKNFIDGSSATKNSELSRCKKHISPDGHVCRPHLFVDQLANAIESLKSDPHSRRHIISLWNSGDMEYMNEKAALSACHSFVQFNARKLSYKERFSLCNSDLIGLYSELIDKNGETDQTKKDILRSMGINLIPEYALSCQLYQRSADVFIGVSYNIASYSLLTRMIAQLTNMVPDEFIWTGGDCHVYKNHIEQTMKLLGRYKSNSIPPLPSLKLNDKITNIDDFTLEDFEVIGYEPLSTIRAPISV